MGVLVRCYFSEESSVACFWNDRFTRVLCREINGLCLCIKMGTVQSSESCVDASQAAADTSAHSSPAHGYLPRSDVLCLPRSQLSFCSDCSEYLSQSVWCPLLHCLLFLVQRIVCQNTRILLCAFFCTRFFPLVCHVIKTWSALYST